MKDKHLDQLFLENKGNLPSLAICTSRVYYSADSVLLEVQQKKDQTKWLLYSETIIDRAKFCLIFFGKKHADL